MKHHHTSAADTLFALANLDLLRGAPLADLTALAGGSDLIDLPAGDVIDRAGTRARQFVGIVAGYVRGETPDGDELVLGPGRHVGAAELIDDEPFSMTYTAATRATVVVTFGPTFRGIARWIPGVADAARVQPNATRPRIPALAR